MSKKLSGPNGRNLESPLSRIDQICDRFEAAWKSGRTPRLDDYLAVDGPDAQAVPRRQLLIELVIIDLEYRWRTAGQRSNAHGQSADAAGAKQGEAGLADPLPLRPSLEDYVRCYPELGPLEELPEDLVAHERRVRRRWGGLIVPGADAAEMPPGMEEFQGTERFFLERRIGAGGMGVVYQAYDRERQEVVAIKTMRNVEATAIYRLKREFRALADIVHKNLVRLHELFSAGLWWFFTMEYVEGVVLLDYVRSAPHGDHGAGAQGGIAPPASPGRREPGQPLMTMETARAQAETKRDLPRAARDAARGPQAAGPPVSPVHLPRLRSALKQVAEGVSALHQAGKLHRDIKPSNVLVTASGRVVLLDFGLTTEFERMGLSTTTGHHIVGTIPYMSPEQATGQQLSPASDLYSIGVMLYEALTGRHPFLGQPLDVLTAKKEQDPPPPCELVAGVPYDLNLLCVDLLQRDPAARPSISEFLRRLGSIPESPPVSPAASAPAPPGSSLARHQRPLAMLSGALASVDRGRTMLVYVHGKGGIGKTTLVRQFLEQIRGRGETVVLAGRCFQRESVPFKALDNLVDALSHYLVKLPPLEADALMPRDTLALSEVFPVLQRVEAVAQLRRRGVTSLDAEQRRRRAFDQLRELLARLGDRRRLVLYIDDFQWSDLDSVQLLKHVLSPPDPPVMLMVLCYRSGGDVASPALREILASGLTSDPSIEVQQIDMNQLVPHPAHQLAIR